MCPLQDITTFALKPEHVMTAHQYNDEARTANLNDHGGRLTDAIEAFGGSVEEWLDLSTGINPNPYRIPDIPRKSWSVLPDRAAFEALENAARRFWNVPDDWSVLPVSGASAAIARIPSLVEPGTVWIEQPTYNEHQSAFQQSGWKLGDSQCDASVIVNPNNPDGRLHTPESVQGRRLAIVDESFADVMPANSIVGKISSSKTIVLKSFGKFWGLAGLRLGFALGDPELIERLRNSIGPWQVSGPALLIGAFALQDFDWAENTRNELRKSSVRLDELTNQAGFKLVGGTSLFRLYEVPCAERTFLQLAEKRILTRTFPYSKTWVRMGLPGSEEDWTRLRDAL